MCFTSHQVLAQLKNSRGGGSGSDGGGGGGGGGGSSYHILHIDCVSGIILSALQVLTHLNLATSHITIN